MLTVNGIDITNAVAAVEIREHINSGAAVLKFSVLKSEAAKLKTSDEVKFSDKGKTVFSGKIYSRRINRDIAEIAAFDSLAELKAVLPVKRNPERADNFVKEVFALAAPYAKMGAVDSCDVLLKPEQYKTASLLNIIYHVAGEIELKGQKFVLLDEGEGISFRNADTLVTDAVLNGGNVIEFDYEHSVLDSYNYIKLETNSSEREYSQTAVVKDDASIKELGIRSITKKVYENNPEQLMDMAKDMLKQKSRHKETLFVTAVGDMTVRAGSRIWCDIDGAGKFWAYVVSLRHRLEGKSRIMYLELEKCGG